MKKTIGFIGSGNMGGAIIAGLVGSTLVSPKQVITSSVSEDSLQALKDKYAIRTTSDNKVVAAEADILFLAVKPNIYALVIDEVKDSVKENAVIVTIAAGKSLSEIQERFGREMKVVRAMPNTPALVGEGMTGICANERVSVAELTDVKTIFDSFGRTESVPEYLMDAVTGVSGSSPALVFLFIESLADGAVRGGMPRQQAYTFAAQAVLGSAKMVLETGKHPGELKDMVCSPGGTTIEAVAELEKHGFRNAVLSAVQTTIDKSIAMSKPTDN